MIRFFKRPRLAIRLSVDAAMVLLFVISLGFRTTGREAHEWVGVSFCLLLIVHTVWNWGWYNNLFAGTYHTHRTINTITNLALVAAMFTLCLCGILNARHVFGFSRYIDGENVRQMHSFAAYWGQALIGVHIGLHWQMIMPAIRKAFGANAASKTGALLRRVLVLCVVVLGVYAFYEREMYAKLFLGFSFDFWPPNRPLPLFYGCNLAIIGVCAVVGHYSAQALQLFARKPPLPVGKPISGREFR